MAMKRACMLIDYQNIHLTARDAVAPHGSTVQQTLIHPAKFADAVINQRNRTLSDRASAAEVVAIRVYRGAPSNSHQPDLYSASQKQRSNWTRDRRVEVFYRTLRYPQGWPAKPAREKGVDVMVAIDLVDLAASKAYDVLLLATHDTDMEPALDLTTRLGQTRIESCGWQGAKRIRPANGVIWHTALASESYDGCRDKVDYWS